MQQQDNQAWEVLKIPGREKILYHWACERIQKGDEVTHKTDVRISAENGFYKVLMSARVAGAELYQEGWNRSTLNRFLEKMHFPRLPD